MQLETTISVHSQLATFEHWEYLPPKIGLKPSACNLLCVAYFVWQRSHSNKLMSILLMSLPVTNVTNICSLTILIMLIINYFFVSSLRHQTTWVYTSKALKWCINCCHSPDFDFPSWCADDAEWQSPKLSSQQIPVSLYDIVFTPLGLFNFFFFRWYSPWWGISHTLTSLLLSCSSGNAGGISLLAALS